MKCLRIGFYLKLNDEQVISCDLQGDLENKKLLLTGFAREPMKYNGFYDAEIVSGKLDPSLRFVAFMKEWNPTFEGWMDWEVKKRA